jgi:hypothetical protein
MNKDERSLLLFLESCSVDYGGVVNTKRMNAEDLQIAERWNKEGVIRFGRIVLRHVTSQGTHWCKLSEEAWKLAHAERRARAERMWGNRTWVSTEDSREVNGDPHLSGMNSGVNL